MNIERALRKRAGVCRACAAFGWVSLLTAGYAYVVREGYTLKDLIECDDLRAAWAGGFNANLLVIVLPGFLLFSGVVYLLGRFLFSLNTQADRYTCLADALCLSGTSITELEKVIKITTHNAESLSISDLASDKDIKALVDLLKGMK